MKSVVGIGGRSGTSTVTSRNHLPSWRSTRSHWPLAWVEPLGLVLAHDEGDDHAAGERQEAHAVDALEAHRPLVVGDRRVLAELGPLRLVPLVGIAHALIAC